MITPNYTEGFFHFYNSYKLNNSIPVVCYLINFSENKAKVLKEYFKDVEFKHHNGNFQAPTEKWQPAGILKVTYLKGQLMQKEARKHKQVMWIDPSKLVMGSIDWIKDELDSYEWVGIGRDTHDENKRFFAGLFGFNRGDELDRYARRCNEDSGNWFSDQRAFTKLKGNYKELNYNKLVSGERDIYNPDKLLVRNLKKENKNKFQASDEYFVKILEKKIKDYKQKYNDFCALFPKKILAYMHHPYEDWCFLSSIKNVQKYTNLDIEICDNFNPEYLKKLQPDLVWSRGGIFLMDNFFRARPDLKRKTVSTLTHGGEKLNKRIDQILKTVQGSKAVLVQNEEGKVRLEHDLKKKKWDIPVYEIPNMVDTEIFKPTEKPKEFIVGYVGRINSQDARYQKGWKVFNYVKEILEEEGIKFKIATNQEGKLPHSKMPKFMNSISCLVLPSNAEGHSNTLNEAMACEVPVITTKIGWHGENCTDKENIIFCPRSVVEIIRQIRYLKDNPKERERIGKNGRSLMQELLNPKKIGKVWESVLNGV